MEALKNACKKNGRVTAIIFFVIAALIFVIFGRASISYLTRKTIDFNTNLADMEGKICTVDLENTVEVYETITRGNSKNPVYTGYAVMLAGDDNKDGHYIGVWRPVKYDDEMDKYLDELYSYWFEGGAQPKSAKVTGVLVKMDSTDKKYMNEFLDEASEYGFGGDVEYYYIIEGMTDKDASDSITFALVMAGISLVLLVVGLVIFATAGSGWNKKLNKFVSGRSDVSMAEIEEDANTGVVFNKGEIVVGKKFIIWATSTVNVMALDTVCWGYHFRRTGRNAVNQLRLYDTDGKMVAINCMEDTSRNILNTMLENCDWIIAGYKAEWEQMYRKHREEFLRLHYYEGRQGNASNAGFDETSATADSANVSEETANENPTEE